MIEDNNNNKEDVRLTISIVSHDQGDLVCNLLEDIQRYCCQNDEVFITLNKKDEDIALDSFSFRCPVRIIRNKVPLGFGANHNKAFLLAKGKYFCVVNPDIKLLGGPFERLLEKITPTVGVVAPKVVDPEGQVENNARVFPTPLKILKKAIFGEKRPAKEVLDPDWVAGMFMIFPSHVFSALNGFDEKYYMYYEDVDICARLRLHGYMVVLCQDVIVQHEAQRKSHTDPIYRRHHMKSMIKFFCSSSTLKVRFWFFRI